MLDDLGHKLLPANEHAENTSQASIQLFYANLTRSRQRKGINYANEFVRWLEVDAFLFDEVK